MKRIKFIFVLGIIIGLLFIGGNILKENNVSIEKKDVLQEEETQDVYYRVEAWGNFFNIDDDFNLLKSSKFKISTWNNQYSFYSYQNPSGYYSFSDYRELSYVNMMNLLTDSQKNKVNNINTYSDFYNAFKDYLYYPGEGAYSGCYKGHDTNDVYCEIDIPSYSILEQTSVKSGYTKQKFIVPSWITFHYTLDDYSKYNSTTDTVSPDATMTLNEIYYDMFENVILKYGDYNQIFNISSWEEYENFISSNIAYTEEQCYSIPIPRDKLRSGEEKQSSNNRFNKAVGGDTYNEPYYYDCPPVVVNQSGKPNISISTTVNEKEAVNTTSNSKLTYRININNSGNAAALDNKVTSTLPEGFSYVDGSASNGGVYNANNNTVTWTLARIEEGSKVTLTYEAYAPNGLSSLKSYVSEATIESSNIQSKVVSNKTTVRLMANPKTNAPLYGIGITLLIVWVVAIYLYIDHKRKLIKQ